MPKGAPGLRSALWSPVSSRPGRGALEASGLGAELAREAAVFREEEAALEAEQKEREREAVRRGP